jgi:hypothetical protein
LQASKLIGTTEALNFAQAVSSTVRLRTNDPSAAAATQYWIKYFGDAPELRRSLAISLAAGKDFDGAIREMSIAAAMFEKSDRLSDLAQAHISLAEYRQMKQPPDYRGAREDLVRALALLQQLHDENQQAVVYAYLGLLDITSFSDLLSNVGCHFLQEIASPLFVFISFRLQFG